MDKKSRDIIFHNEKLLFTFFHIEKCAGSSLRLILYNFFSSFLKPEVIFIPEKNENNINLTNQAYSKIRSKGHEFHKYLSSLKVILCHISKNDPCFNIKSKFEITVLRNPIKRAISHYDFFSKEGFGNKRLDQLSKTDLERWVKKGGGNAMTWRCSGNKTNLDIAKRNIIFMDHVLLVETFEKDLKNLEFKLNEMFYQNKDLKVLKKNVNINSKKIYPQVFLEELIKYLYNDIQLYKFFCFMRGRIRRYINLYRLKKNNL